MNSNDAYYSIQAVLSLYDKTFELTIVSTESN